MIKRKKEHNKEHNFKGKISIFFKGAFSNALILCIGLQRGEVHD